MQVYNIVIIYCFHYGLPFSMKNNIVVLWLCYFQKLLYKIIPV